jgi:hypothetical protein
MADERRVESGPVRIGDDWAGVFIRGDNAMHHAMTIGRAAAALKDTDLMTSMSLAGLARLFASCREPCEAEALIRDPEAPSHV